MNINICAYAHIYSEIYFFPFNSFIFGCFSMVSNYSNEVSGERKKLTANEMRLWLCFPE